MALELQDTAVRPVTRIHGSPASLVRRSLLLVALLLMTIISSMRALPVKEPTWSQIKPSSLGTSNVNQCQKGGAVETLCQVCAKETKAAVTYPYCCENKENVRDWCQNWTRFPTTG